MIFLVQINAQGSPFVPCGPQWNHATSKGEIVVTQPSIDRFLIFWYKSMPKDPLLSHVVLNGITQPFSGEIAIPQPFPSAIYPLKGCVIPLRTTWDKKGSLGIDFYQKDQQSVNKWLSYGNFSPERLRESIENHMGKKAIPGRWFVLKRLKIGQEMAELRLFSPWEVVWFHLEPHGTKGDTWVLICTINIQNLSRNGWVMAFYLPRGCVISLKTSWN